MIKLVVNFDMCFLRWWRTGLLAVIYEDYMLSQSIVTQEHVKVHITQQEHNEPTMFQ